MSGGVGRLALEGMVPEGSLFLPVRDGRHPRLGEGEDYDEDE